MTKHHVTRILPWTPDQLFHLVGDVRRYPEFVPWINALTATRPIRQADGSDHLSAEATVGFSIVNERFATRVVRHPDQRLIEVKLIRGPFRHLANEWRFVAHDQGTEVLFDIDFEFKSRFLDAMLAANFERAVHKLITCFEDRARALYG